ncbi:MAG: hypothetical protein JWP03_692 [Phycisphaerales bacterium]|nr:hypothetical protein [Phycisphaerales bacterium]
MPSRLDKLDPLLGRLDNLLAAMPLSQTTKPIVERWRSDAAALRFHLRPRAKNQPLLAAVIGGTGTGKSTVVNRLLGVSASATSFRRTFTSGAVAIAREAGDVPDEWLGVEHVIATADRLPARGQAGSLIVVPRAVLTDAATQEQLLTHVVLIDTPDLDGDQPAHHAEADRAFRWAQAILFLVTPEKYQMTELLPYYRLANRYGLSSLFVMNKCEEQAVAEDYRGQLGKLGFEVKKDAGEADAGTEGTEGQSDAGTRGRGDTGMEADGGTQRRTNEAMGGTDETAVTSFPASPRPRVSASSSPASFFIVPRDDAGYDAPPNENLDALRTALSDLSTQQLALSTSSPGLSNRAADVVGRFEDQILSPLRQERREADQLVVALRGMETPAPGVDVNPVTQDLQRRLQQRSILYLMGPQRVLDRVRQAPGLLIRLPRVAWDYVMRGEISPAALNPGGDGRVREVPDFSLLLTDQFAVVQSRIDDLLRSSPAATKWMAGGGNAYEQARLDPTDAGRIVEEELAELRTWLEKRWNATPRDTRAVQALLKFLPGGKKLTATAEAAPYLLVVALIAHHALFGTDLLVLGGYTLATWLTERLSNEVAAHTRTANARIADRFARLAHEQIEKICSWLDRQAPPARALERLDRAAGDLATAAGIAGAQED